MHKIRYLCFILIKNLLLIKNNNLLSFIFKYQDNYDYCIIRRSIFDLKYLAEDRIIKDLAIYNALLKKGCSVGVVKNFKNINNKNAVVILNPDRSYKSEKNQNYQDGYINNLKLLNSKKFKTFPSINDALLWENKVHMHEVFDSCDINCPKTHIIKNESDFENFYNKEDSKEYIIKEVNSCSSNGIHVIKNKEFLRDYNLKSSKPYLLQKVINMRKDLRVIFVKGKIVNYYWRINTKDYWQSTASSNGSDIYFYDFPEQWNDSILNVIKSLNMTTGAFDICWDDDNVEGEPIILEVSPNYQPNPNINDNNISRIKNGKYTQWKKSLSFSKSGYIYRHINLIDHIYNEIANEISSF